MTCVFSGSPDSCGEGSEHQELALATLLIYVAFNIAWNIAIIVSVKQTGALTTFVALKGIFPVATILFAYVNWPLLGRTPLHWLVWVSVLLILPSIAGYQWASMQQEKRARLDPPQATCCWPIGHRKPA